MMVMTSGNIPYEYVGPQPFRVQGDVGMSGVLLEQAHFVLLAELRRYHVNATLQLPITKYINLPAFTFESDEPKGCSPFFLDSPPNNPGGSFFVNNILTARTLFTRLMTSIGADTDYASSECQIDWLNSVCPSPSSINGDFLRRDPITVGLILDINDEESILGSSGIFFDTDVCEIRYQPYSRMSAQKFLNAHNDGEFLVKAAPLWPCFQKTGGSLIPLNTRDSALTLNSTGRNLPFQPGDGTSYDSVGSGLIQFDGDVLLSNTDYMAFQPGSQPSVSFTYSVHGARFVGNKPFGTDAFSRVFVSPTILSEGLYSVVPRTTHVANSNVVLESGGISQWPRPNGSNSIESLTVDGRTGYAVFDETFWVTDWGVNASPGPIFRPPSGLAVLCPFTGDALWVRHAEHTEFGLGTSAGGQMWGQFIGMERLSTDSIMRVTQDYRPGGPFTPFFISFVEFDDDLNFVGSTDVNTSTVDGGLTTNFTDMFWDGDNSRWVVLDNTTTGAEVFTFDSGFSFVESYEAGLKIPTRAARINGAYWAFDDVVFGSETAIPGNHLQKFELIPPTGGEGSPGQGNVNWLETKPIQLEVIPNLSGSVSLVHDVQVISSDVGPLTAGIWLLMPQGSSMVLIRVIEETDSFTPVEAIRTNLETTISTNRYDFIPMPI